MREIKTKSVEIYLTPRRPTDSFSFRHPQNSPDYKQLQREDVKVGNDACLRSWEH